MTEITQVSDDKGLHKALTVKIRRSDVNIEQSRKKYTTHGQETDLKVRKG